MTAPLPSARRTDGPQQRILVVEDDPLVRQALALNLEDFGYAVAEAASAGAAMALMAQEGQEIAAAVIDMGLPDGSGDDLLAALRASRPDLPAIIASGSDIHEVARRFEHTSGVGTVGKPYRIEALVALLRDLIAARG